jgi:MoxR-like ATPase
MKPSEVLSSLQVLANIRKPAFLWGPPGVGKSQIVAQVATSLGVRLIDIRAVLLDPVDLRGLPTVEAGKAAWAIPAFLPEDGAGILFLDELNAAPPLVQAACYQLVLDRALGEYRLPDGWSVFAAGNREGDRACRARWPTGSSI